MRFPVGSKAATTPHGIAWLIAWNPRQEVAKREDAVYVLLEVCLRCVAATPDPERLTASIDSSISNFDPYLNRLDVCSSHLGRQGDSALSDNFKVNVEMTACL
jgi:hypothetical protein